MINIFAKTAVFLGMRVGHVQKCKMRYTLIGLNLKQSIDVLSAMLGLKRYLDVNICDALYVNMNGAGSVDFHINLGFI